MNDSSHTSRRIVIVGGGVAGLSIAVRLAQAGLAVTLLEASRLGFGASARNQGWLYSGAWFAPDHADLTQMCYQSLKRTLQFCPECLEPQHDGMAYLISKPDTLASQWTEAWSRSGIPFEELALSRLTELVPELDRTQVQHAYLLPDRAIRTDVLLTHLAAAAENAGAEIRTETPVADLIKDDSRIDGVVTGTGERLASRLVILATGAEGATFWSQIASAQAGQQPEHTHVLLKSHLVAIEPEVSRLPFCVVDRDGFNHLPHAPKSVFGDNRWAVTSDPRDHQPDPAELEILWDHVRRFLPDFEQAHHKVAQWAGTTVQVMHLDQIEPGRVTLPTVIDHSTVPPGLDNLLSVYPGRASLWAHLAEETRRIVLNKLETQPVRSIEPPWTTPHS